MKYTTCLIILALAGGISIHAQDRISKADLEQIKKNSKTTNLLADSDPDFKIESKSGLWPNESAVILGLKTQFEFDKKGVSAGKRIGRNVMGLLLAPVTLGTSVIAANTSNETTILVEETERRKLELRDRFAVDQFSIIYFRFIMEGDLFAARVIKKNGTIQPISLNDAVRVQNASQVPAFFRSYTERTRSSDGSSGYYKLAVPGLEEGDILEYAFRHHNNVQYGSNPDLKEFKPIYYLCNREMPVAKQVIEITTEDPHYSVGTKSLKGAPEFRETQTKDKKTYRWEDLNREKEQDTRFVNEYLEQPSVKFQVVYAKKKSSNVSVAQEATGSKDLDLEKLGSRMKDFWFHSEKLAEAGSFTDGLSASIDNTVEGLYKTMKKRDIVETATPTYIQKAYYTIRSKTMVTEWNDYAFAKVFSGLLEKKKIPHEIVITSSNARTSLEKIAFMPEIRWMVKCKDTYYVNPHDHYNPGDVPVYLSGNQALSFDASAEKTPVSVIGIPKSDTLSNQRYTKVMVNMDMNNLVAAVDKTVSVKGQLKFDMIDDILSYTPYMENDYLNYDATGMFEDVPSRTKNELEEKFMETKKELKEQKSKMMEEVTKSEYTAKLEKYEGFKVVEDGRSVKKSTLTYNEKFKLADLTSSAGEEIILSLTSLMGDQVKIKSEEKKRIHTIDMRYPMIEKWTISLNIPEGYEVSGVQELNQKTSNSTGSLQCIATEADGRVSLDIRRVFSQKNYPAQEWPRILEILDATHDLSQAKVLLRKK